MSGSQEKGEEPAHHQEAPHWCPPPPAVPFVPPASAYPQETPLVLYRESSFLGEDEEMTVEAELNTPSRNIFFARHSSLMVVDVDFAPQCMFQAMRRISWAATHGCLFHHGACWVIVRTTHGVHLYNVGSEVPVHPSRVTSARDRSLQEWYRTLTRQLGGDSSFAELSMKSGTRIRLSRKPTQQEGMISDFARPGDDVFDCLQSLQKQKGCMWRLAPMILRGEGREPLDQLFVLCSWDSSPELSLPLTNSLCFIQHCVRALEPLQEQEGPTANMVHRVQTDPVFRREVEDVLERSTHHFVAAQSCEAVVEVVREGEKQ